MKKAGTFCNSRASYLMSTYGVLRQQVGQTGLGIASRDSGPLSLRP